MRTHCQCITDTEIYWQCIWQRNYIQNKFFKKFLQIQQRRHSFKKFTKDLKRQFTIEDMGMANKYIKMLNILSHEGNANQITMIHAFISTRC